MFDGISSENLSFLETELTNIRHMRGERGSLENEKKLELFRLLGKAELFETFLHTRYVGQKRFSLEGAETLIPLLWEVISLAGNSGCPSVVIGMPHRGRLNVLANIFNKSTDKIFAEFEDMQVDIEGSGDVKYHKGYSAVREVAQGKTVELLMAANPSHLESVDPVVEGMVRAKKGSLAILVHGDAAISGQGVVYETLQLSRLRGYSTGGTIHIIINNHIGFTTVPRDSRSTDDCTDIAKAFAIPVLHIDAEDPESCLLEAQVAFDFRQQHAQDIFLDLNCYRKLGHNESDEPSFTQPLLYREIKKKKSIRLLYHDRLIQEGLVDKKQIEVFEQQYKDELGLAFQAVRKTKEVRTDAQGEQSKRKTQGAAAITEPLLKEFAITLSTVPEHFAVHPRIERAVNTRRKKILEDFSSFHIDWSFAEALALAELLYRGKKVRFSGQDTRRGTFSQRHGVWIDQNDEKEYYPHANFEQYPGQFELIDSPLSEFAALGFSILHPEGKNGHLRLALLCCCHMAMKGKVLSIHQQEWSGF
jgi:2-oxoglutarate dehydrogenase E1 component